MNQDIKDGKQLPLNAWAMQELSRLTPFNIFTPDSANPSATGAAQGAANFAGVALPQVQGAALALAGTSPFGSGPLKGPHGDVKAQTGPALASAFEQLLESFFPLARYAKIAEEGGKKSYASATVLSPQVEPGQKAGTPAGVVKRIFDPNYSFEEQVGNKKAPAYAGAKAKGSKGSSAAPPPPPPPPPAPPPPPPPPPG